MDRGGNLIFKDGTDTDKKSKTSFVQKISTAVSSFVDI